MFEKEILEQWIDTLRQEVQRESPSELVIPAAKGIYWVSLDEEFEIPEWIIALANGNPRHFGEVIKVVRKFM